MKRTRHTAEQIIRKLKTGEQLIAQSNSSYLLLLIYASVKSLTTGNRQP